jgi:antitoxin ParD1/3/4
MEDLRISLSAPEHAFLDEQATSQGHASAEDYATAVIRAELKAKAQERLEALLVEGLEGEATEWTDADSERLLRLATSGR